jgi:hypothetical protein
MKVSVPNDAAMVMYLLPCEFARADAEGYIERKGNELWCKNPHCRVFLLGEIPNEKS